MSEDNWTVFEDTQEAIIDQKLLIMYRESGKMFVDTRTDGEKAPSIDRINVLCGLWFQNVCSSC